jgi:hypothetical protein
MHWVQEANKKHWDEHKKNIEWVRIAGEDIQVVE